MSPRDFRKISHPEPKILNRLVNCGNTHANTHRNTQMSKCRAVPPTVGQLIKCTSQKVQLGHWSFEKASKVNYQ